MEAPLARRARSDLRPGCDGLAGAVQADKRAQIMRAAVETFLETGFEAASMDRIAARARVSKATIYRHFDGKNALFQAIVGERCRSLGPKVAEASALPAETALAQIGTAFLDHLLATDAMPLYRVVLSAALRFPELGRAFYEAGPDRLATALAGYLAGEAAAGRLCVGDARLAAEQFLGMVLAHFHLKALLAVDEPPGPAEREHAVRVAVRTFLSGAVA